MIKNDLEDLTKRYIKWHNNIIIYDNSQLGRLVGLMEKDSQIYYVINSETGRIYVNSSQYILSLKSLLTKNQYNNIDQQMILKGIHQQVKFISIREELGRLRKSSLGYISVSNVKSIRKITTRFPNKYLLIDTEDLKIYRGTDPKEKSESRYNSDWLPFTEERSKLKSLIDSLNDFK